MMPSALGKSWKKMLNSFNVSGKIADTDNYMLVDFRTRSSFAVPVALEPASFIVIQFGMKG
jgi:hypothetical protein